jgi:hypothetical protein
MRYDWYYPGDGYQAGVTALFSDDRPKTFGQLVEAQANGEADDVFDVALYGVGTTEEEYVKSEAYLESRQALENLLQLANVGLRVLQHVPAALVEAQRYHDEYDRPYTEVTGGWLDDDGSLLGWEEGEEYAASIATIDTLTEIASLFHAGRPENSEAVAA